MNIYVVKGKGEGSTLLSSFDAALKDSGVYNFNLIYLSSVVPPQARIHDVGKIFDYGGTTGDRLYTVMAKQQSAMVGESIGAGIGWYQFEEHNNAGVFVEHELSGVDAQFVTKELNRLIEYSIRDLCNFRGIPFQKDRCHQSIAVTTVTHRPTTVVVLAVFQHQPWGQNAQ